MTCGNATVMVGILWGWFIMPVVVVGRYTSATADAQWHVLSAVCEAAMQPQAANICNSDSI